MISLIAFVLVVGSATQSLADDSGEKRAQPGILRILIPDPTPGYLPRHGLPQVDDEAQAERFAARLGLRPVWVALPPDAIETALERGEGDLAVAQLAVTLRRKRRMQFTRPVAFVDEVLVGRRDLPQRPGQLVDLRGRTIFARPTSSHWDTLEQLNGQNHLQLKLRSLPAAEDLMTSLQAVAEGHRDLMVADSHTLDAARDFLPNLTSLLVLKRQQPLAWAVKLGDEGLLRAANAFLARRHATTSAYEAALGDLDAIRQRGVLRVLMRNNATGYFLHRGQAGGFEYDLMQAAAKALGLRLKVILAPSRDVLFPWLRQGKGDVVAASLTVTPERSGVASFTRPYLYAHSVLVFPDDTEPPASWEALGAAVIHLRKASSHYQQLAKHIAAKKLALQLEPVDGSLEAEALLAGVASGRFAYTVVDKHKFEAEQAHLTGLRALPLYTLNKDSKDSSVWPTEGEPIALAVRPNDKQLLAALNQFLRGYYRGLAYNMAKKRYFMAPKRGRRIRRERVGVSGQLSKYDALFQEFGEQYAIDWRLIAAQAYEESRFNPGAVSFAGARGLLQVMPRTGREMGVRDLHHPRSGVGAGVAYLRQQLDRLPSTVKAPDRLWLALASYNAGFGHIQDARRLARRMKLNPDRWFGHVETTTLLLREKRYYRHARYGYCRGTEPVAYVSRIRDRYHHYASVNPVGS